MRRRRRLRRVTVLAMVSALACVVLPNVSPSGAAPAGSALIRVNQVGYPDSASKRAYLMSTDVETGATFTVRAGGSTVFTGSVGSDLGKWSKTYTHVYPLDFDALATAGTYTIEVAGPLPASSPSFRIATGTDLYAGSLTNALRFYGNERDGANYIPSALRTAPAHLNDKSAKTYLTPNANSSGRFKGDLSPLGDTIDASGGWWDAGDYIKFVQTTSYTVDMLLAGVRDFPAQMGAGIADLELHRGVTVRRAVPPALVERPDLHAVLPSGDRLREREHHRRPRHLAASAGRRHVRRHRPAVPVHPQPPGLPRGAGRRADQPEPRRSPGRGVRGMLTGLPRDQHEAREPMPARGGPHLRPGRHRTLW